MPDKKNILLVQDIFTCFPAAKIPLFLYHPQANPVKPFMKPLGRTMKIVHYQNQDKTLALTQLLVSYQATPHPATCNKTGDLIFQYSYTTLIEHCYMVSVFCLLPRDFTLPCPPPLF